MTRINRRRALGLFASSTAALASWAGRPGMAAAAAHRPRLDDQGFGSLVAAENTAAGSRAWHPTEGALAVDDVRRQIQGYASVTSVNLGEKIAFHLSTARPQNCRIEIFRIGYYGGTGGRLMITSPVRSGKPQPLPTPDPKTGRITCRWPASWRFQIPADWTSGLYVAVFVDAAGHRSATPFVVRDDAQRASLCIVLPFTTYQAYNMWPVDGHTGRSLYHGQTAGKIDSPKRAVQVSFDRPYSGDGLPRHFLNDVAFVRWAESIGLDVTYATSEDLHYGRVGTADRQGLIFPGHDEYWSAEMRDNVETTLDAGNSLAFFGANNVYWNIRFSADARIMACYRHVPDPYASRHHTPTTNRWRASSPAPNKPEQLLLGIQYRGILDKPAPLVVRRADHWLWNGTGLRNGDKIPNVVAVEADIDDPTAPRPTVGKRTLLAASPFRPTNAPGTLIHRTCVRELPNGAIVFVAGTLGWTMALAAAGAPGEQLRQATGNVIARMTLDPNPTALEVDSAITDSF